MRQQDISLKAIGLSSLLALPWALKFLWAPWVDRLNSGRFGARRSWIIPLQFMAITALAILSFADPSSDLVWILCGVLVINFCSATQDIATDALAVSTLGREERGLGNALQVGGYRLGMILGGGVILMLLDGLGWQNAFLLMALALGIATIPILLYREPSPADRSTENPAALRGFFSQSGIGFWLIILVLYKGLDALAGPMVKPMLIDLGYGLSDIGAISGTAGSISGLVGAGLGGLGVLYLGRRRALLIFGGLQSVGVLAYALPAAGLGGTPMVYTAVVADTLLGSMATTALFTMMMDHCRSGFEGTDYTIQASVVVVTVLGAATVSGFIADAIGYQSHFLLAGSCAGLGLVGVAWLLGKSEALNMSSAEN